MRPPLDRIKFLGTEYRGTSLTRNSVPLGPYIRTMPRALWWSWEGGGYFL